MTGNYGIIIPQSFTTVYGDCVIHCHFEFSKKWDEFKEIIPIELEKIQSRTGYIDLWLKYSDLEGWTAKSLQERFNEFCAPKTTGYSTNSYKKNNP